MGGGARPGGGGGELGQGGGTGTCIAVPLLCPVILPVNSVICASWPARCGRLYVYNLYTCL